MDNYTLYKNNKVVAQGQEIIYTDTLGSRGQYIYRCETNNSVGIGRSSNTTLTVGGKYEEIVFSRNKQGKTKNCKKYTHTRDLFKSLLS